ncbi:glycosyltransferase [Acinetobacter sp. CFCC 11171]|uniref:glycosyltransferase n=1 Tax=Acinetobacter sp. CFCC 11171 TaxID=1775558 RepID=UPI000DD051D8|nr:glycosyltransferase [Acinetobacter sp. CFCC 11171]
MNKILFIIDHLGCGGAEKITLQLAEYLANNGHDIHLAVLNGNSNHYSCSKAIKYIDLKVQISFSKGKMWKNKTLNEYEKHQINELLKYSFDLIITGYNNGHWLAPYLKGNVWHWIHGDLLEVRKFNNPLKQMKEYLRFFKNKRKFSKLFHNRKLITVNRDLENKAKRYANPSLVKTIANGVTVPSQYLNQYSSTDKKWDVIFVGRLVPIKQVDHALKAFAMCETKRRMAIVGDGTERRNLENLARDLGILNRVDFLGWIEEPYKVMLQSRCLVLSSLYEGSPVTLAEAISLDIPVVSYNSSLGIQDLLNQQNFSFMLVEKQNIVALGQAIQKCLHKPYHYDDEFKFKVHIENMTQKILDLRI